MEYRACNLGRVFLAKLRNEESIYDEIEGLAALEDVKSAVVFAIGGIRSGGVVTGPQNPSLQNIQPIIERFDDAREMVAIGTLFRANGQPSLHLHAGIGRGDKALVGCPREKADCFLILEVLILEITGVDAERVFDPQTGFHLLSFLSTPGQFHAIPTKETDSL